MFVTNNLPQVKLSNLINDGAPGEHEEAHVNRLLCLDGLAKREHQQFVNLSEKDQKFFRILRDKIFDDLEWVTD